MGSGVSWVGWILAAGISKHAMLMTRNIINLFNSIIYLAAYIRTHTHICMYYAHLKLLIERATDTRHDEKKNPFPHAEQFLFVLFKNSILKWTFFFYATVYVDRHKCSYRDFSEKWPKNFHARTSINDGEFNFFHLRLLHACCLFMPSQIHSISIIMILFLIFYDNIMIIRLSSCSFVLTLGLEFIFRQVHRFCLKTLSLITSIVWKFTFFRYWKITLRLCWIKFVKKQFFEKKTFRIQRKMSKFLNLKSDVKNECSFMTKS